MYLKVLIPGNTSDKVVIMGADIVFGIPVSQL